MLDLFHYHKAWCSEPQILTSSTPNRRNWLTSTRTPRGSCIRQIPDDGWDCHPKQVKPLRRIKKRNCCILLDLFHYYMEFGIVTNYTEIYFTFIHLFINTKISGHYIQELHTYLTHKICVVNSSRENWESVNYPDNIILLSSKAWIQKTCHDSGG